MSCQFQTFCGNKANQCRSFLTASENAAILTIELIPVLISFLLPIAYAYATRGEYRLGVCAMSVNCNSGMFVLLFILLVAFSVPFYGMLWSTDSPCETPLGACNTISCVCGNYVWKGYVFMFFCLALGSYRLYGHIAREMEPLVFESGAFRSCHLCCPAVSKILILCGSLGIVLTGIFPDSETTKVTDPVQLYGITGALHTLGLVVGGIFAVLYPYMWYLAVVDKGPYGRAGVVIRTVYIAFIIWYLIGMSFSADRAPLDLSNFCSERTDQFSCENWPCPMPRSLADGTHHYTHLHDALEPRYNCKYISETLSESQSLYASKAWLREHEGLCVKHECTLYYNAIAVVWEFGWLWLVFTYFASFTMSDSVQLSYLSRHHFCFHREPFPSVAAAAVTTEAEYVEVGLLEDSGKTLNAHIGQ